MQYMMVPKREEDTIKKATEASSTALVRVDAPATKTMATTSPVPQVTQADTKPQQTHRRHKRTRAEELLLKVRVGDGMLVAKVEDSSVGGLFARTQKVIPVGAFVEMSLLRPGHDELPLTGVVVDDTSKRAGLAVKFESLSGLANAELRRTVLDQQVKHASGDPDADVSPTQAMRAASDELTGRDRELDELRRKCALLTAENERLKNDSLMAEQAHKLVGRLQVEIERMKARTTGGGVAVDPELLGDIKRDAETAWTAIARMSDNVDKIK